MNWSARPAMCLCCVVLTRCLFVVLCLFCSVVLCPSEQHYQKQAAQATSRFSKALSDRVLGAIEEDKKDVRMSALCEELEAAINDASAHTHKEGLRAEYLDSCYSPILLSGACLRLSACISSCCCISSHLSAHAAGGLPESYNLKFSASTHASQSLSFDTIIFSVGTRYHNWCSHLSRTLLINPTPEQARVYGFCLRLFETCLANMRPGVALNKVWSVASLPLCSEPSVFCLCDVIVQGCGDSDDQEGVP